MAFSNPRTDLTYGELHRLVDNYCRYFLEKCRGKTRIKALVSCEDYSQIILILLALLKLNAVIVIAGDVDGDSLNKIIEAEDPDIVCLPGDIGTPVSSPEKPLPVPDLSGGFEFFLYDGKAFDGTFISADRVLRCFSELTGYFQGGQNNSYLIAGRIGFLPFVIESMWCLLNGIHLLHYPCSTVAAMIPDAERFPMDLSLFFFGNTANDPNSNEHIYDLVLKSAEHADLYGYSAIWTPERHFNEFGGKFPNPGILSAAIAARTSKVQIRSGSIVSPLHHTVRIAEDWALIDQLSGGRVALSFASGWNCNDFVFYPERYNSRHEFMMKQIDDLKELWKGGKMRFENGVCQPIDVKIYPTPVQKEIAIWVTVSGKTETFIDAGKIGANILTHLLWQDPADLVEKIQAYRNSLQESGFDPRSRIVTVMLHTYIGDDIDEVKQQVKKPLKDYIRSSWHLVETMVASVSATRGNNTIGRYGKLQEEISEELKEELVEMSFERFFSSASLIGDIPHCKKMIRRLRSYGVDELACLIDFGLDKDTVLEGLYKLNEIKAAFAIPNVKRYGGAIVLRTEEMYLDELFSQGIDLFATFSKVILDPASVASAR
jgi:natural product biosynthesis luciferase-like monooxygenase protein